MRTLVEKEIRLLLPAFAGAMALAILPVWVLPYYGRNPGQYYSYLFLFGIVMLALSSFGREFGLRTLPFILAQPLERARIWWTKIAVLTFLVVMAFEAWWLSGSLFYLTLRPALLAWRPEVLAVTLVVLTAGGLWMTLLVRQAVAAFWLTLLIPLAMVSAMELIGGSSWMICLALGLYAVAGFFLARRQFLQVQDTAWTGGVLSFGRTRAAGEPYALRQHRPWAALFGKELQSQQVTLIGIACLLVLHLGVVVLRKAGADMLGKATLSALEMFGGLWLIVPLLAGSQSVADERQLGTLDGLLCLPFPRRIQFAVKMFFVLVLGGLSGALLCAVESVGSAMGVGANLGVMGISFTGDGMIPVCFAFLALSLVGFYASTLTRGIVPALGAGAVASMVFWVIDRAASAYVDAFGWHLWPVMAFPTLTLAVIWLAYGNFRYLFESGRRWRRNIFGLIAVLVAISGSATAVYHRVWELITPLEWPHGSARLPAGKPILLDGGFSSTLAIVLPDGRLWVWEHFAAQGRPGTVGSHFVPGSNWVAACTHWRDMVALRSDGTLWVSDRPGRTSSALSPPPLIQFGAETDWQSVAGVSGSFILLKRDGTLWGWGTNSFNLKTYQGLRAAPPYRLGAKSDWVRILRGVRWVYAWKRDGAAWSFHEVEFDKDGRPANRDFELAPGMVAKRLPTLDHIQFQRLNGSPSWWYGEVGVRDDGTLWFWNWLGELKQIGQDSNWAAVAGGSYQLAALKTDGSLWKWDFTPGEWDFPPGADPARNMLQEAPVRMGTHNDWVGLEGWMGELVTLSADGILWRWQRSDLPARWLGEPDRWLVRSRRPVKIANLFDASE